MLGMRHEIVDGIYNFNLNIFNEMRILFSEIEVFLGERLHQTY